MGTNPRRPLQSAALLRSAALIAMAGAWAISLLLPALTARGGPTWTGFDLLLQGWEGLTRGVFSWLANPLFVAALLAAILRRHAIAGVTSVAAVLLAITSFATERALSERMASVPELTFESGFYLWLAACCALCVYSWAVVIASRRTRQATASKPSDTGRSRD